MLKNCQDVEWPHLNKPRNRYVSVGKWSFQQTKPIRKCWCDRLCAKTVVHAIFWCHEKFFKYQFFMHPQQKKGVCWLRPTFTEKKKKNMAQKKTWEAAANLTASILIRCWVFFTTNQHKKKRKITNPDAAFPQGHFISNNTIISKDMINDLQTKTNKNCIFFFHRIKIRSLHFSVVYGTI